MLFLFCRQMRRIQIAFGEKAWICVCVREVFLKQKKNTQRPNRHIKAISFWKSSSHGKLSHIFRVLPQASLIEMVKCVKIAHYASQSSCMHTRPPPLFTFQLRHATQFNHIEFFSGILRETTYCLALFTCWFSQRSRRKKRK